MKRAVAASLAVVGLLGASVASAAMFKEPDKLTLSVPIHDDLYTAGDKVTVPQDVDGDLFVAGAEVTVEKLVTHDLTAAGGKVYLNGEVKDDARVAGGTVVVSGHIVGDLIVAGGEITVEQDAVVDGDVVAMGGKIRILGKVGRNLRMYGGDAYVSAPVGGTFEAQTDSLQMDGAVTGTSSIVVSSLALGSQASFAGPVKYWTQGGPGDFSASMKNGATATYDESLAKHRSDVRPAAAGAAVALAGAFSVFSILSAAVFILILTLATRTIFAVAAGHVRDEPGWSLLYGFLYFAAVPVLAFLFMITLIGLPVGLFLLALYAFSFVFLTPLAAMVYAKWTQTYYKLTWKKPMFFLMSVLFCIGLKLLLVIPVAGWIVKTVLVLIAFGALLTTKYDKYKQIM